MRRQKSCFRICPPKFMNGRVKMPIFFIREGDRREALIKLLDEEPTISIVVLAAGIGRGGPGPIIEHIVSKGVGQIRVPVTIVPGSLGDDEIIAIT